MALRSFAAQPVRSLVLACGFGTGIACMAGLLGVGEVILEQSRSPHLRGGGDLVVYGAAGDLASARFVASQLLASPPLAGRARATSPSLDATLHLVQPEARPLPVQARGSVPGLARALSDPEISAVDAWRDSPADRAWIAPGAGELLRAMDRFRPVPDVPARAHAWAEWLYFNGRAGDVRFYLSFVAGPASAPGLRRAGVRLQLERDGRIQSYVEEAEIGEEALVASAPDLEIGACRVRLSGTHYRIEVALYEEERDERTGRPDLLGEFSLEAEAGRALPPFEIGGAGGWVSGYVVPVLSGPLDGWLSVDGERVSLDGGIGYHDHNWGFWEGVTWQWGQVAGEEISLVYGRVRPPADAADPDRVPGFLAVLGPEGLLGFATEVTIDESGETGDGFPRAILVEAEGESLRLTLELTVRDHTRTRLGGPFAGPGEFLQLDTVYRVRGAIGERAIDFTAPGAAETFRGGLP
jgi:hypothetical protein